VIRPESTWGPEAQKNREDQKHHKKDKNK